jgi:formamidopyrimidine-DNA glycosylase
MPELPDLQVFSLNLNKKLAGKVIDRVELPHSGKSNVTAKDLQILEKQKLIEVYREGKELFLKFSKGDILGLHLMLNGELYLLKDTNDHNNAIVELWFDDKTGLTMTDYQGMANVNLNPEQKTAPDALAKDIDLKWWTAQLGKSKAAVKNILLDQKTIRGIGNAYADEILWEARISPFSAANKIPADKVKDLAHAVKSVLAHAEKQIVKKNPDIISGEVRDFLNIHHTKKTNSPGGAAIQVKAGTRKTYYTDEQILYK